MQSCLVIFKSFTSLRSETTFFASFVGNAFAHPNLVKYSDTVSMYRLPEQEVGEIGPTKLMAIWYIGDFSGTG